MTPELSLVIPLRDEESNVLPLHAEFTAVFEAMGRPYEAILVEDGSGDQTFARLCEVQARDARVRVIRFAKHFGQTAAFAAGFAAARGSLIVTADGDLQNDLSDIPTLIRLAASNDIVCGWRKHRRDAFLTRQLPSMTANWLLGLISGIRLHDNGCSLKVFRAEVVKPLKLRPGMHRYLPAIASQLGGRVAELPVNHRPRRFGRSKYGLSRTFTVVSDLMHLRSVMRAAVDPTVAYTPIYEIAEVRETGTMDQGPRTDHGPSPDQARSTKAQGQLH